MKVVKYKNSFSSIDMDKALVWEIITKTSNEQSEVDKNPEIKISIFTDNNEAIIFSSYSEKDSIEYEEDIQIAMKIKSKIDDMMVSTSVHVVDVAEVENPMRLKFNETRQARVAEKQRSERIIEDARSMKI